MRTKDGLTHQQKKFCNEYLISLNATDAAIKAGYGKKSATSKGCQLLTNIKVSAFIDSKMQKAENKAEITAENILKRIDDLANNSRHDNVKIKALELLGKHLAMFTDKVIATMNVKQLSDQELEEMLPEAINILTNKGGK